MLTILGSLAGVLTTGAWVPQLIRCWRTRSTRDISWGYLFVLAAGVGLWVLYGALTGDSIIVMANAITLAALSALAGLKLAFRNRARPVGGLPDVAEPYTESPVNQE